MKWVVNHHAMKLRGPVALLVVASTAFFAVHVGASSATTLCRIQLPECVGHGLPVPESLEGELVMSTSASFSQMTGTNCEVSNLELETTSNLGEGHPLLAKITKWKFGSCGSCSSVTALGLPYKEAEFEALQDGSPVTFHGNGTLRIFAPEFKLSGCSGGLTCIDSAKSIALEIIGGTPMDIIAHSVPMKVSGTSCGTSATFSAKYVELRWEALWLEPAP
jgi:hypothetical protein